MAVEVAKEEAKATIDARTFGLPTHSKSFVKLTVLSGLIHIPPLHSLVESNWIKGL